MSTFNPKGPIAETQLDLFYLTVWVTGFIFVVVGGVFVVAIVKFRERPNDNRPMPSQGHGNPLIEIGLIGASVLLLVIIAVPTLQAIWYTHDTPMNEYSKLGNWYSGEELSKDAEDEVLIIRVIGYQWWWEFEYPQLGINTANEMVIPAGKAVHLELRSVDVIHSFWLPRIAGKVDLIPGRANAMWIQAGDDFDRWALKNEIDTANGNEVELQAVYKTYLEEEIHDYYYGQCAEFCGDSHARMLFRATVVGDDEFAEWVESARVGHTAPAGKSWDAWYDTYDQEPESLVTDLDKGAKIFMGRGKCIACHAVEGNPRALGVAGPNLTNVGERLSIAAGWLNHHTEDDVLIEDEQYDNFVRWIKETDVVKPGNRMWKANGNGIGELLDPDDSEKIKLLTDDEIHYLALYLQSLK